MLENSGNRIKPEFYDLYRNSPAGTILDVPYYDRSTGQDWTGTTVKIKVGTDVPIFGDLRNLDRYAWQHDRDLSFAERTFFAISNPTAEQQANYDLQKHQINKALVANLAANPAEWAAMPFNQLGHDRALILGNDIAARSLYIGGLQLVNAWVDTQLAKGRAISEFRTLIDAATDVSSRRLYYALRALAESDPSLRRLLLLKMDNRDPHDVALEDAQYQALLQVGAILEQQAEFQQKAVTYGAIGGIVGSTIGQHLGQGSTARGILYSSLLGEIGERLAVGVAATGYAEHVIASASQGGLATLPQDVAARAGQAAVGSISSWLMMELGEALGIEGFGAELFQSAGSAVTSKVISNLLDSALGPAHIFNGFKPEAAVTTASSVLIAQAVGSFLGAKLGALVVAPQTQAAQLLSSIGSGVGGFAGVGIGQTWIALSAWASGGSVSGSAWLFGNLVLPGVGAFIGFVLGSLIGNLFGKKKPKIPTASAETLLQAPYARYELGTITSNETGNRDLVISMATAARDTLNQVIGKVAFNDSTLYVTNLNGLATDQVYGHTSSQIYVKINGAQTNFDSPDKAVEYGALTAIRNTKIVGGDIFAKRAIFRSGAPDLVTFAGDLQVADDYRLYSQNRSIVNGFITGGFGSLTESDQTYYANNKALIDKILTIGRAGLTTGEQSTYDAAATQIDKILKALVDQSIAAPWVVTLQRSSELKLDKFAPSDFYGGLRGFLDSFHDASASFAYEDIAISTQSSGVQFAGLTDGLFSQLASSATAGRAVIVPTAEFYSQSGAGFSPWDGGAGMGGANFRDASAATSGMLIDDFGSSGGATIAGGDDIALGSAFNDTLQGRTGWDWLDGGAGDDLIVSGRDQDVALGGAGNDTLYGDLGDDYLSGGAGNDLHYGGEGADTFSGKAGNDTMYGEGGDDLFIVNGDGGTTYDYMDGGSGSDTLSFERFGLTPVILAVNAGSYYGDAWTSIENLIGGGGDDSLTGDAGSNVLKGGAGQDTLAGGAGGADTLEGGSGADSILGDAAADVTLSYAGSTAAVQIDLTDRTAVGGDAEGDHFANIDHVIGSRYADALRGDGASNRLDGGRGDDWLVATAGSDVFEGGEGRDFVDYSGATSGVTLYLGAYTGGNITNGYGSGGLAAGHSYARVEGVVGSAFADNITAGEGAQVFVGGKGNDTLGGGAGDDTYVFDRGDGSDVINEDTSGWNTLSFGEGVLFQDLILGTAGGSGGYLDIYIRGTTDKVRVAGNWANANVPKLKSLDLAGVAKLDLDQATNGVAATDGNDTMNGVASVGDLLFGANGDDVMRTRASGVDQISHVFVGGLGNDTAYGSTGDDSYGFDRTAGNQMDYIVDTGGEDTLVFGPSVAAEDLIYEVMNGSLYIGVKEAANPNLTASQVSNKVLIADGGTKYYNIDTGRSRYPGIVEFVTAGGATIDLRKLNLNWNVIEETIGGGGPIPPVILDLDGDGLDISALEESRVVAKNRDGTITKVAWAGPKDAFLAVDRDGDGAINRLSEISFVQDKEGAKTDLEGLTAWDTNGDGVLDAKDKDWGKLLVWTDKNQNGRSTKGELQTLKEAGITSFNLKGAATGFDPSTTTESYIQNTFSFTREKGEAGTAYDVALARQLLNAEAAYAGKSAPDGGGDGELGRVLNDAKADAFKAVGKKYDPAQDLTKRVLNYKDVVAAAKLDFSDHDNLDEAMRTLWDYRLDPGKAADQKVKPTDQKLIDALVAKPASADRPGAAPGGKGSAPVSLGLPMAGEVLEPPAVDASAPRQAEVAAEPTASFDGAAAAPEFALPAASARADDVSIGAAASNDDWWRGSAETPMSAASGLAALITAMDDFEGSEPADAATGADTEQARKQQLLLQAIAGFNEDAGATPAVWRRNGEFQETGVLGVDTWRRPADRSRQASVF